MWQTNRGQVLARQLILHEVPLPEAIRRPIFLWGHEMIRQQAFCGSYTTKQDELVWKLILDGYELVRTMKIERRKLLMPMGLAWLFGQTDTTLMSALQTLPSKVRGPLAYVFGMRMLVNKNPNAASSFFKLALKDADSNLKSLVQTELGRM
jgi:hypothetical protein